LTCGDHPFQVKIADRVSAEMVSDLVGVPIGGWPGSK
jgi:hypothetical protein